MGVFLDAFKSLYTMIASQTGPGVNYIMTFVISVSVGFAWVTGKMDPVTFHYLSTVANGSLIDLIPGPLGTAHACETD